VARGNHGLYLHPGDQAAAPFSPEDVSSGQCGLKEPLEQVQGDAVPPEDDDGFSAGEWFVIIAFFPSRPKSIIRQTPARSARCSIRTGSTRRT
ncbi:MAG: hypothetical protein ACJ8DK_05655, partial [Microvirga sp.]